MLVLGCAPPPVSNPGARDLAGCELLRERDDGIDGVPDAHERMAWDDRGHLVVHDHHGAGGFVFQAWRWDGACEVERSLRVEEADAQFRTSVDVAACDAYQNPIRTVRREEFGEWRAGERVVDDQGEREFRLENTYGADGALLRVVERVVQPGEYPVLATVEYAYDAQGRVVWESLDEGREVFETTWHDQGPYAERRRTRGDAVWIDRQEIDEHGRVTLWVHLRAEGDLLESRLTEWDPDRYAVARVVRDLDGDGIEDGEEATTCGGDPVEWCETRIDGARFDGYSAGPLDGVADSLLRETWDCP